MHFARVSEELKSPYHRKVVKTSFAWLRKVEIKKLLHEIRLCLLFGTWVQAVM